MECKRVANQIYHESKVPNLPIHPNCACNLKEISTLVFPKYMITSVREKAEYDGNAVKFPIEANRVWYKSLLNDKNQDEYIVFSNDGHAFYTSDGGETFKKLLITSDTHSILMNLPTMPYGDKEEFGKFSDTYKIIKDLGQRWMAMEDQEERDRLHELAEKARRLAREGTPLKYGQDVSMKTLHTNAELTQKLMRDMKNAGYRSTELVMYPWFVGMTLTLWDFDTPPSGNNCVVSWQGDSWFSVRSYRI